MDSNVVMGWGRTSPSLGHQVRPSSPDELRDLLVGAGRRGGIARGLGRSYGDAAQSGGGLIFDLTTMSGMTLNESRATMTAQGGASLDDVLRMIVPRGFFVPVTPGTRFVTVGGAIAADVHGKNHHSDGSWGTHVQGLELMTSSGELRELAPDDKSPDAYWATVGGMGLTGVIVEATFGLIAIETSMMAVDTLRLGSVEELMAEMTNGDDRYRYSVAWVDSLSPSGRGVLTRGDHAQLSDLPIGFGNPRKYDPRLRLRAPRWMPAGVLNRFSIEALNEAWFRKAPRSRVGELMSISAFFHPLDAIQGWNTIYGKPGFLQYQFAVPETEDHIVRLALERLRRAGAPSFLTVLKRFGLGDPAPLSFPMPGWTLAADIPTGVPGLRRVLDELDDMIIAAGGRFYLAKDSRMSRKTFEAGYARLPEWRSVRDALDPRRVFVSDQARRLGLVEE